MIFLDLYLLSLAKLLLFKVKVENFDVGLFAGGPTKVRPFDSSKSTKSAFSDRKPYLTKVE